MERVSISAAPAETRYFISNREIAEITPDDW
jgi:hypothetical protein